MIVDLPPGIFAILLQLWNSVLDTFSFAFSGWFQGVMNNFIGGTIIEALIGPGVWAVLGYWLIKFVLPT